MVPSVKGTHRIRVACASVGDTKTLTSMPRVVRGSPTQNASAIALPNAEPNCEPSSTSRSADIRWARLRLVMLLQRAQRKDWEWGLAPSTLPRQQSLRRRARSPRRVMHRAQTEAQLLRNLTCFDRTVHS
mgnify:CR=1 FL=1